VSSTATVRMMDVANDGIRTFFESPAWTVSKSWTPTYGWDRNEVVDTNSGPATNDRLGTLYQHLRNTLSRSIRRMRAGQFHFRCLGVDVEKLRPHVDDGRFDRIEVRSPIFSGSSVRVLILHRPRILSTANGSMSGGPLAISRPCYDTRMITHTLR
jgi:hypothetical protein